MKSKMAFIRNLFVFVIMFSLCSMMALTVFADEETASQTREFNELYDRMLDDASTSNEARGEYRAVKWSAGQCDDPDDPIYKVAGPGISAGFDTLSIELRSPDGSVTIEDLTFAIRISDNVPLKTYELTNEDFVSGVTFNSGTNISQDWSTLTIDFAQTESGINSTNPDAMVGFHLYVTNNTKAGALDVRKVYVTKGTEEVVIAGANMWWEGGEATTVVPKAYDITTEKLVVSDVETSNNIDEEYQAIVLGLSKVGAGNVSVSPIDEAGNAGSAVSWDNLTDLNETKVSSITDTNQDFVIALSSLGLTKVKGVKIIVEEGTTVSLTHAFFTNCVSEVPDKYFPVLDKESIVYLSKFDFEYLNAGADYNQAVADCVDFNMDYILSYSSKNNIITNGHLVLDAQGEAFTSIKFRSKVASDTRRYMVLKYKLDGRNDLTNFRFDAIKTVGDSGLGMKYPNDLYAGKKLQSISSINPYKATNGYNYLVVDLIETWGTAKISGLDMYISDPGKILIDEIFFADKVSEELDEVSNVVSEAITTTGTEGGYEYCGGIGDLNVLGAKFMKVVVEGDTSNLRVQAGKVLWVNQNAEGTMLDKNGELFEAGTGKQTFLVDLEKSGVTSAINEVHFHNDVPDGETFVVEEVSFLTKKLDATFGEEVLSDPITSTAAAEGYSYVGWINGSLGKDNSYMKVTLTGDVNELRFEFVNAGGVLWFGDHGNETLRGIYGEVLSGNGEKTFIIDFANSGIDGTKLGDIHVHKTFAAAGDTLTITSVTFGRKDLEGDITWANEALASDFGGKELVATAEGYSYVGWINGSVGLNSRYMLVEVEGNIAELRFEFENIGTRWVSENAEGTLVGVYGQLFTGDGKQVLIIDLDRSGVDTSKIAGIHVHNTFASVGDVLKITSVKFNNSLVPEFDINDDTKPELSVTVVDNAKVGNVITITTNATDNYDENVTVAIKVTLNGTEITCTDGKFTPGTAGTYTVEVTAKDAANNVTTVTKTIVVSVDVVPTTPEPTESNPPTPNTPSKGGCSGCDSAELMQTIGLFVPLFVIVRFVRKKRF